MSIFNSPRNERTDSEAIAPVTLKTINNNARGATLGKTCENKIFIFDPPVILAESSKGFTLTCKAWDLIVITEPPNPPIVPNTTARCQTCNSAKADIINNVSKETGFTKVEIENQFDSIINSIKLSLSRGERVDIRGFGSFLIKERKSRVAINPSTKEKIKIDKKYVPSFKVSKLLKEYVNKSIIRGF